MGFNMPIYITSSLDRGDEDISKGHPRCSYNFTRTTILPQKASGLGVPRCKTHNPPLGFLFHSIAFGGKGFLGLIGGPEGSDNDNPRWIALRGNTSACIVYIPLMYRSHLLLGHPDRVKGMQPTEARQEQLAG